MAYDSGICWTDPWTTAFGRAGIRIIIPDPAPGATTVVATWECWVHATGGNNAEVAWWVTAYDSAGAQYGAENAYDQSNYTVPGSGVQDILVATWHPTIPVYLTALKGATHVKLSVAVWSSADSTSITINIPAASIPAVPPYLPAAPSGASVTRISNTSQHIAWTNNPVANSAPYDYVDLERWDNVTNAWYSIATLPGGAISYMDNSTIEDRYYQYRLSARNVSGSSSVVGAGAVYTQPKAPASCSALRSGSDIVVSWPDSSTIESSYEVQHAIGGVWDSAPLANVPAGTTSYVHIGAANVLSVHNYRVVAIAPGSLRSVSPSPVADVNTVQPPGSPTNLTPSGNFADALRTITFGWTHNPVDGTSQTAYQIRYRISGSPTWTTLTKVTSGSSSYTMPAATLSNGQLYEWQVSTWGLSTTQGAWSASATFTTAQAPTMTFVSPTSGQVLLADSVSPVWNYFSSSGSPQAFWEVSVYVTGSPDPIGRASGYLVDTRDVTFDHILPDNASYTLKGRVQSGNGLYSDYVTRTFTVNYLEPIAPPVALTWDPETGWVSIQITNPLPDQGGVANTHHNKVYRLTGSSWVLIADNVPVNVAVTDRIPPTGVTNTYKVVAVAPGGGSASAQASIDCPSSGWLFVTSLGNQMLSARGRYAPGRRRQFSRDKELHKFAGRTKPVSFTGPHRNYSATISVQLDNADPAGNPDAWMAVEDSGDDVCYRDPHGMRIFASLGELSFDDWSFSNVDFTALSVPLTEVAHVE